MRTSSCPVLGALGAAKLPHLSFLLARQCRMLPSNRPNLPTPAAPALGAATLWPETAGCSLQTLQTLRNLPNRLLELPAVAGQAFPFLLAQNCRMLPSNPSNPPKPARPALGAASCATPSLSFSTGPKLLDAPFKPFKPFQPALGAASCGRPSLSFALARNCRMLPSDPSNPPKPAKPALGAASCGTPSLSFSTGPKLPDAPFKAFKPSETCETGSWSCQLCHAKSFLFYWPETAGCSLQTLRNLRNRRSELPAVAGQVFPSLLGTLAQIEHL